MQNNGIFETTCWRGEDSARATSLGPVGAPHGTASPKHGAGQEATYSMSVNIVPDEYPAAVPTATDSNGSSVVQRVVISIAACVIVTWQLAETMSFQVDKQLVARCCHRGSPLQWYLLSLMALSALDGLVGVVAELILMAEQPNGQVPISAVQQEIGVSLVLGELSQHILSLMILGLGIAAYKQGPHSRRLHARVAIALGTASLVIRKLPAPLVLVTGIFSLQRTPRVSDGADGRASGAASCSCCSLRCALRPLLALALIETLCQFATRTPRLHSRSCRACSHEPVRLTPPRSHPLPWMVADAWVEIDDSFLRRLNETKREARVLASLSDDEGARSVVQIFDSIRPEQMLEMAQQQLGELVQVGVVCALGIAGRSHGLKHTLVPVAAALIPGVPTSFSVVLYFLLETRQSEAGGTLLLPMQNPVRRPGVDDR